MIFPSGWRATPWRPPPPPTKPAEASPPVPNVVSSFPVGRNRATPEPVLTTMSPLGCRIASVAPPPGASTFPPLPKVGSRLPGVLAAAACALTRIASVLRPGATGAVRTMAAAALAEGALLAGEPPAETAVTPPKAMAARPMPAMMVRGCRMCYLLVTLTIHLLTRIGGSRGSRGQAGYSGGGAGNPAACRPPRRPRAPDGFNPVACAAAAGTVLAGAPVSGSAPFSARAGWRRPEVAEHEVASIAAGLPAGHKVGHGVLTGEDPAERCLAGCRHDAAEAPDHAGISSGLPVVTVKGSENGSPLPV